MAGHLVNQKLLEWIRLKPSSRLLATRLSLTDDDAAGHVALGKYCIVHKLYDAAEQALQRAVRIDPSLKGRLADVAQFRKGPSLARGKVTRPSRGRIQVAYTFDHESEALDFYSDTQEEEEAEDGESYEVPQLTAARGQLQLPSGVVVSVPELGLEPPLRGDFMPGSAPPGGYLLIQLMYEHASGEGGLYLLLNDRHDRYLVGRSIDGVETVLRGLEEDTLSFEHCRPDQLVRFDIQDQQVSLRLGSTTLASRNHQVTDAAWIVIGFSGNPDATFGLDAATIAGRISDAAYKRAIAERRTMMLRSLQGDLGREPAPEKIRLPRLHGAYLQRMSPNKRQTYRQLLTALEAFARDPNETRRLNVLQGLERCDVDGIQPSAPILFWRAWLRLQEQEMLAASSDLERAIKANPSFSEALAHQAWILQQINRYAASRKAATRAISIQPDNALARATLALLAFYSRSTPADGAGAVDQMRVAALLSPSNGELSQELRQLEHVLAGPPWPQGVPTPIQTAHYTVHTDLPKPQAKLIVDELERMWSVYAHFLPPGDREVRRGVVYVFATLATYSIYSELTSADPAHNTLGYYHPGFKCLYLFKSNEDTDSRNIGETLSTLRHEAFHQYVDNLIPRLASWANEGIAEHFGTTRFVNGKPAWGVDANRLKELLQFIGENDPMPLEQLMGLSHPEFMEYEGGYPHSWSIIYLFLVHNPSRYRATLMRYLALLGDGASRPGAFQKTFGQINSTSIKTEWRKMLQQLASRLQQK